MSRTTNWQRDNAYTQWTDIDTPWVVPLAAFDPGETLMRTRLDIQLVGYTQATDDHFPHSWEGVQTEIALVWAQAPGGYPDPPPGYFDTALYPWIWAQQVSWETDVYIPAPDAGGGYCFFHNTVESRSIDCHSARATDPDSYSMLWLVVDYQIVNPFYETEFQIESFTAGWSVMSKLPAGS